MTWSGASSGEHFLASNPPSGAITQWGSGRWDVTSPQNSTVAKGDAQEITDAVVSAGSAIVTSVSGKFKATDVGKSAFVRLAGTLAVADPTVAIVVADGGAGATNLPTGTYKFAYDWATRGFTGQTTKGTSEATYVQTVANHIINLTAPALPAGAELTELFCTQAPGGAFAGLCGFTKKNTAFAYTTGLTSTQRLPATVTSAGNTLQTTIASFQSATQVTLAATATLTNTGTSMLWGTDDSAARDAAVAAVLAAAKGEVYFPPPAAPSVGYLFKTAAPAINVPLIYFRGLQTKLFYTGTGDMHRVQLSPFDTNGQPGFFTSLTLDGNYAQDAAVGMHYGDANQGGFVDLTVQFFNGVGSRGLWMDNRTNWCERHLYRKVWLRQNTIDLLFDVNGGNNSFAHNWVDDINLSVGAGATGIQLQNTAALVNSKVHLTGNTDIQGTTIKILDTASMGFSTAGNEYIITMENSGPPIAPAYGFDIAAGAGVFGAGVIEMAIGNYTSINAGPGGNFMVLGHLNVPGIAPATGTAPVSAFGAVTLATQDPAGALRTQAGSGSGTDNNSHWQLGFGGLNSYPHFISSQHNTNPQGNQIKFWTSDGTLAGVFPTNAILALILESGHLFTGSGAAPATSTLGANVTSVTFTGNDRRGTIAIVMAGALAANTKIATCTFARTYGATGPQVFLINQTSGVGLAVVNFYKLANATGVSFDLACNQALAAGTYTIGYIIEG